MVEPQVFTQAWLPALVTRGAEDGQQIDPEITTEQELTQV